MINSFKRRSFLDRVSSFANNLEVWLAIVGALLVTIPGVVLLVYTEGQLRAIGLGLLVYSFSFFVLLPGLLLAATAKPGSNSRLLAAFACFWLAFFTYFYLTYTTNRQDIKVISLVPIMILGTIFFIWWVRDFFRDQP